MRNVNIGSFNIYKSNNPLGVRALLSRFQLDVTGLQEVDINAERSGYRNIPKLIADGAETAFSESIRFGSMSPKTPPPPGDANDESYGVAIVSRLPIIGSEKVALGPDASVYWQDPTDFQREPRSALVIQTELLGVPAWIINTHLAHTPDRSQSSEYRLRQVERIAEYVCTRIPSNELVVLLGDFNATPENDDLKRLGPLFRRAAMEELTYPVSDKKPLKWQIDHFFFRNLAERGLCHGPVRTHADAHVSDHKLCMIELRHGS